MPSSSAYAAPLDLDLRPGRLEAGARALILALALVAIASAELPPGVRAGAALLAAALALADARRARHRPERLRLHADGSAECADREGFLPATPLQATDLAGLPQIQWVSAGAAHSVLLFPDRLDGVTRQRLRVWLATHRPQAVSAGAGA